MKWGAVQRQCCWGFPSLLLTLTLHLWSSNVWCLHYSCWVIVKLTHVSFENKIFTAQHVTSVTAVIMLWFPKTLKACEGKSCNWFQGSDLRPTWYAVDKMRKNNLDISWMPQLWVSMSKHGKVILSVSPRLAKSKMRPIWPFKCLYKCKSANRTPPTHQRNV